MRGRHAASPTRVNWSNRLGCSLAHRLVFSTFEHVVEAGVEHTGAMRFGTRWRGHRPRAGSTVRSDRTVVDGAWLVGVVELGCLRIRGGCSVLADQIGEGAAVSYVMSMERSWSRGSLTAGL